MLLKKLSQSFKISLALMVSVFSTGLLPTTAAYAAPGQEVCPDDSFIMGVGGWDKTDGIDATSWDIPEKSGYTVTDVCYKASNTVVYPDPITDPITSTVWNKDGCPEARGCNYQNISHASVYYTPNEVEEEPAGTLTVDTVCEGGSFSGVVTAPEDGTATYTINGSPATPGTFTNVAPGEYTVQMFVNGTLVDSETVTVEACEEEVTPAGTLTVDTVCEGGSFSGVVTAPEDGTATYTINGSPATPGTFTNVAPGEYTVQMFVNGTLVDSETVTVEACEQPPFECPSDMEWVDVNEDQTATEDECFEPTEGICHATGNENNDKFVRIEKISPAGIYNGHMGESHQNGDDIIPPFTYQGQTYLQNWDAAGQAIYNNDCNEPGRGGEEDKTSLCHATGSNIMPYVFIQNISVSGAFNGHMGESHQNGDDIIPPFTYQGQTYSQNWDTSGQATYNNGCVTPPTDVCPLVPGTQTDTTLCPPGQGGGQTLGSSTTNTPQVQGASTELPAALPSTGGEQNPMLILLASLMAYGIAYLFQGRRQLNQTRA